MKINDLIVENKQLDELTAGQVGTAVGKGVGAVAKGVGAVAGGVAGAGKAFMKGFRGGKDTVGGTDTPAAKGAASTVKPGTAAKPAAGNQAPATGQTPATGATTAAQSVDMKAIQGAIAKLPQNQRVALRTQIAKKAGVK